MISEAAAGQKGIFLLTGSADVFRSARVQESVFHALPISLLGKAYSCLFVASLSFLEQLPAHFRSGQDCAKNSGEKIQGLNPVKIKKWGGITYGLQHALFPDHQVLLKGEKP